MKFKYKPGDVVILATKSPAFVHFHNKPVTTKSRVYPLVPSLGPFYNLEETPGAVFPETCITGYAIREEKVVITASGRTTIVSLYNGKNRIIRRAEAKCNPEDTFDLETGARLAFSRLMPGPESASVDEPKPSPKYTPMQQLRIRAGTKIHHNIRPGSVVTVLEVLTNHIYRVTGPATLCNGHALQSVHEDDLSPL